MDFMQDFIEDCVDFKKQCEVDGDNGEAQVKRIIEENHTKEDREYKEACEHGVFLRIIATNSARGKQKEHLEAQIDIADAIRDIHHELKVLSRIGDKSELSEEEWFKLRETRDYIQIALEGIRQFKRQIEEFKPEAKDGDEVY